MAPAVFSTLTRRGGSLMVYACLPAVSGIKMTNLNQNFIAGEWLGGSDEIANINPSDLSDTIGAYAPRYFMASAHVDPAQAVDLHLEVGAEQSMPIHWGTFQLTIEPFKEPPRLLVDEMHRRGLALESFRPVKIGETLVLD